MAASKFLHEEIYRGKDLIEKLSSYKITVCGAGALGSNLVENLSRTAFQNIKVIDKDRVELHNISTQIYGQKDVGAVKTDALKARIFRDVGTEIISVNKELTKSNVKNFLKDTDLIVDAFDNSASRRLIQEEVRKNKIPCIHIGLYESYGECIWNQNYIVPEDVKEGDVCDYPLARNIIMLAVIVATEEILSFFLDKVPRQKNWTITLKDLIIKEK